MSDHPYLTQTTQGPMVVMPPDAEGDREHLTINQAHARLDGMMRANRDKCCGESCEACALAELLNGIR